MKRADRVIPTDEDRDLVENSWEWHRTRDIGITIGFWPLNWRIGIQKFGDFYGGSIAIAFGPFVFRVDGNACDGIFGRYEDEVDP